MDDGTVFDTSRASVAEDAGLAETQPNREYTPLTIDVGAGQVIDGLENALRGLEQSDTPTVEIPPENAYGEWSEERVREFDLAELKDMLGGQTPEEGAYIETQEGELAEILAVEDDVVRVDFNPQLAGETLQFDIEIVDVN